MSTVRTSTIDTTPERGAQRRGDRTRQALLDAALVEFAASGFEAASTRDIAGRAGVRQGQLTYHFASKHALWQATVDHLFDRFDELLAAGVSAIYGPGTNIVEAAREVLEKIREKS